MAAPSLVVTAEGRQGPGRLPRRGSPGPLCGTGRPPGAPGLWGQNGAEPLPTCLRDPRLDEFGGGAETLHIVTTHTPYIVSLRGDVSRARAEKHATGSFCTQHTCIWLPALNGLTRANIHTCKNSLECIR